MNCYALGGRGGRQQINVGGNWPAGVIWGFPGGSANPNEGNNAKPQANLAEFTIGAGGMDYYDISNVVRNITVSVLSLMNPQTLFIIR